MDLAGFKIFFLIFPEIKSSEILFNFQLVLLGHEEPFRRS